MTQPGEPVAAAEGLAALLDFARRRVRFHAARAPADVRNLAAWPLMSKRDVEAYPIDRSSDLLSRSDKAGGYLIASGGTSAAPNYFYFSSEEARRACRNIAWNFKANGLVRGDTVVNYFLPGGMWSSFLMVDRALSMLPVTVLPMGYSQQTDFTLQVMERFCPNVITGIPSLLLDLARQGAEHGRRLALKKVFYAGEMMSPAGEELLAQRWGSCSIRSAGYALTDFGPIGWQCLHCGKDEFHPFDDVVVEILNQEIVVTSLSRRLMPLIRYRTGDRGVWSTSGEHQGATPPHGPTFRLMGRSDGSLLIWGCKLPLDVLLSAFEDCGIAPSAVQAVISRPAERDLLRVLVDGPLLPESIPSLREALYRRCPDLIATMTRAALDEYLLFEEVPANGLVRSPRTGKAIPVIDERSGDARETP